MNEALAYPAKILLVEDDVLTRASLKYLLASAGYQVLEASDGQEGVDLFAQQQDAIDLVVSDLMMPRLDGLEMLERLLGLRPQIKLVLVTGAQADEEMWRRQGVYDWLPKSQTPDLLLCKVATALAD
jgi:two-component system, cell cycle sensor histidine kinase and response regulator CckA